MDLKKVTQHLLEKEEREKKREEEMRRGIITCLRGESEVFERYGVEKAYVYGSIHAGRLHGDSDIDIAVDGDVSFETVLRLHNELSAILSMTADVRKLGDLPFAASVREKGILIYERKNSTAEE